MRREENGIQTPIGTKPNSIFNTWSIFVSIKVSLSYCYKSLLLELLLLYLLLSLF